MTDIETCERGRFDFALSCSSVSCLDYVRVSGYIEPILVEREQKKIQTLELESELKELR